MAFGKKWLRPEIDKPIYYFHILIISTVVLAVLQYLQGGNMLTVKNILFSTVLITIGDIIAHTLLKID